MPGVNQPWWRYQQQVVAGGIRQGVANGTQQQNVITNLSGEPVINFGLIPGSNPPQFGMQLVNKQFGAPLAFFGEDNAGNVSLKFYAADGTTVLLSIDATGLHLYNASGVEVGRLGTQSDGTYGLRVLDQSGNPRTAIGELPNGDYGTAVYSPANDGTYQEIRPVVTAYNGSTVPVGSTSYEAVGPSLSATIGASGQALITLSAAIGTTIANQTGQGIIYIDGSAVAPEIVVSSSGGGTMTVTASAAIVATGLSAGSHTFELYGLTSTAGASVNMGERAIQVLPL